MASASFCTNSRSPHVMARLDNGNVVHWGEGSSYNPSGDGTVGDADNEMGNNLTNITNIKLLNRSGGVTQSDSWDSATTLSSAGRTITKVLTGYRLIFVILDDGKLLSCGYNLYGVLGIGSSVSGSTYTATLTEIELGTVNGDGTGGDLKAIDVACSSYHAGVITDDGSGNGYKLKCWGYNGNGQLGYENTTNIGSNSGEMGDNLGFVDLGTVNGNGTGGALTVKSFTCATYGSAAILSNGAVKLWGNAYYRNAYPIGVVKYGNTSSTMGDNLASIDLQSGSAEDVHFYGTQDTNFVLLTNGKVLTWGNANWQTGLGNNSEHKYNPYSGGDMTDLGVTGVKSMAVGFNHCGLLFSNGTIKVCGNNGQGQFLQGNATQNYTSSQTWANANTVNLGSGRSVHSANYKYSFQSSNYSLFVLLDNETLAVWGHGNGYVLGYPYNGSTHYGDGAGETTPIILDLGTSRTLKWEMRNPDSLTTSIVDAIANTTNGIRTGVASTRNANFLTLANSYRSAVTATTITAAENRKRRKQMRREMLLAVGDDNISYTDSSDKSSLISAAASSNTSIIDQTLPIKVFYPDPDTSSTIDISSLDLTTTSIFFDTVADEAITVTTDTGSQTWTMNSDGDKVTIVNESSSSSLYEIGDTVSVGSYSIVLYMFGSVGGGQSGGGSGGDPYVCPLIGEPYKLADGKYSFRMLETHPKNSMATDKLVLNCFTDYSSNKPHEQMIIDKTIKNWDIEDMNIEKVSNLTFYKYAFIQHGNNRVYIDLDSHVLYSNYNSMIEQTNSLTEEPSWFKLKYNNVPDKHMLFSKITSQYNNEESKIMTISLETESNGKMHFHFHRYHNPQIRTGLSFIAQKITYLSGALYKQSRNKHMILKNLSDKRSMKDKPYNPNINRKVEETFINKDSQEKVKILC